MAVQEHRFPCDSCGADMRFAPDAGELVCNHCGNTRGVSEAGEAVRAIKELDFRTAIEAALPDQEIEETRVISCPNCGAQIEFDAKTHSSECPFCATPVVTDTGTHRHIKPRGVVPFILSERQGHAAMANWLGALWFAPNGLREFARKGRKLEGIYVPYWTFDADTKSKYRGERGTVYYENQTVTRNGESETRRVAKTRWRPATGGVARAFDDVLVLASKSLPKRFTDALQPWDLSALEPYQPEYLVGFRAEGYTVEIAQGFGEARALMDRHIARDVRNDIGGDKQRIHDVQTAISKVTFKHVLLPVWLAAYKYRGKTYRFVINGQSGRVQGERPYSTIKIVLTVLGVAVIAGVIGYFLAGQQ